MRAAIGILAALALTASAFVPTLRLSRGVQSAGKWSTRLLGSETDATNSSWDSPGDDSWQRSSDENDNGVSWTSFEPSETEDGVGFSGNEDMETETWLDTLQSLTAEETQFNAKEADRADKARQMEEWGFDSQTIANTLGVATDTSLEDADDVDGMKTFREESYMDETDLETVESHTTVDWDDEVDRPVRSQMVYVDEHTCIGAYLKGINEICDIQHLRTNRVHQLCDDRSVNIFHAF